MSAVGSLNTSNWIAQNPEQNNALAEVLPDHDLEKLLEKKREFVRDEKYNVQTIYIWINQLGAKKRISVDIYKFMGLCLKYENTFRLWHQVNNHVRVLNEETFSKYLFPSYIGQGFIHFSKLPNLRNDKETDRIYVKVNPSKILELAPKIFEILGEEFLEINENPDAPNLGITTIKIACPNRINAVDGIVIYLGVQNAEANQAQLSQEKVNSIAKKLNIIQEGSPELFGDGEMPCKKSIFPNIATNPFSAAGDSATMKLSQAIVSALNQMGREKDIPTFRAKIIEEMNKERLS